MEPLNPGSVVVSLKGRDKGGVFLVIGTVGAANAPSFLLVSDGRTRPLENPKKKNPIHLQTLSGAHASSLAEALEEGTLTNKALREGLRPYQFHV